MSQKAERRARKKDQRRAKIEEEIRRYNAKRRRRLIINLVVLTAVIAGSAFFIYQIQGEEEPETPPVPVACGGKEIEGKPPKTYPEPPPMTIDPAKTYTAVMETSCGTVEIELADEISPNTVNSFIFLAREGFYEGRTFHRIVDTFAVQGGSPRDDGSGDVGYQVVDPPPADFKYEKGVVAMAKAGHEPPGTADSGFFIVPGEGSLGLPPDYAVLGRVTSGDDTVQKLSKIPTTDNGRGEQSLPTQRVFIVKVTIREA